METLTPAETKLILRLRQIRNAANKGNQMVCFVLYDVMNATLVPLLPAEVLEKSKTTLSVPTLEVEAEVVQ